MRRRGLLMTMAVAALLLLSLLPLGSGPASAQEYPTSILDTFQNGNYDSTLIFSEATTLSTAIDLDTMAIVFGADMNATSGPYTYGGLDYPLDPYIDIGADGTIEWEFSGLGYGRWGLQDVFNDGSDYINLTFEANQTRDVRFKLPKGSEVVGGAFTTGGWPVPYWGPEYVVSNPDTTSKGEFGPSIEVFKDLMFEAWETKDPTISDGNDYDIVYRWFDGEKWSGVKEITPPGDYYADDSPFLAVYDGKLYCAWSASETEDFFADDDLYMRWTEDGENWSPLKKVSPTVRAGMNDWPMMEVYQGKLYILWKTLDSSIADVTEENDMDIVYRWWDGSTFGPIEEITKGDDGAIDWSYDMTVYNNRLYVIWETDTGDWMSHQPDILTKSYDGFSWSNRKNLCGSDDTIKDEIPRAYVWFNPVRKMDELYVIWGRGDGQADGSGDIDIVISVFDGTAWSPMTEVSQPNVRVQNMGHRLIGYEDRLYAIWIDGKESVEVDRQGNLVVFKIFGDIVIRSYDGYGWSTIKELTPSGTSDKASDPELCVYKDKLYASWSYPHDASATSSDWDIIIRNIDFQDVTLDIDIGADGKYDWSGELSSSQHSISLNRTQIEAAMTGGSIVDEYGNEITEVAIRLKSRYPAKIRVHDLRIEYEYKVPFEFKDMFNTFLENERSGGSRQQPHPVSSFAIEAGTGSEGRITFEDLEVEYLVNYAPFLFREIPIIYMEEDTDLPDAIDLEEHYDDDWDDGRLRFQIVSMEDANLLEAHLTGSMLGFRTPTENWWGTSNITVRAIDGFDVASKDHLIMVKVLPVNDAPVLDFIPDQELRAGERFRYQVTAVDVDGDRLKFNDTTDMFTIDEETGVVSFIPSARGEFSVNISVSDGFGGSDWQVVKFDIIGESTSSAETGCYTLLAIVALAIIIILVAMKLRHEFKWGPVAPERLKIPTEEEEEEKEERGRAARGKGKVKGKGKRGRKRKEKAVIPGTDATYDSYDSNRDGFLDDDEWDRAVKDIRRKKAERRERIKERAKRLAKKEIKVDKGDEMGDGEEGGHEDATDEGAERGEEDGGEEDWSVEVEDYVPPGLR